MQTEDLDESSSAIRPEGEEQVPPSEVDAHDGRLLGPERREPVLIRSVRLHRRVVRHVDLKGSFSFNFLKHVCFF